MCRRSFILSLAILAIFGAGLFVGGRFLPFSGRFTEKTDTCIVYRTIVDSAAFLAQSRANGYELVRVASLDSLKWAADHPQTITQEVEKPVIITRDSVVYIHVPMEERTFTGSRDSVCYKIVTTGYNTAITNVSFTYPHTTITNTKVIDRTRKIGFDVTAGLGGVVTPSGKAYGGFAVAGGISLRF